MSHTHIGQEDWPCIGRMLRAGHPFKEIARTIGKDPSAVGRHVKEYGGRDGYDAREVRRRKRMKRIAAMDCIRLIRGNLLRFIKKELIEHKSPEQIAGVLSRRKQPIVASTIYRYIKERAPHLKKYLRSKKGKYRRRRGTKIREIQREQAKKRRIDERPKIVERHGRIGDFDGQGQARAHRFICRPKNWIPDCILASQDECRTFNQTDTQAFQTYSKEKTKNNHSRQRC